MLESFFVAVVTIEEGRNQGSEARQPVRDALAKSGPFSAISHLADHHDPCCATPYITQKKSFMDQDSLH